MHIEEELNEGRGFNESKPNRNEKNEQNIKRNARDEKNGIGKQNKKHPKDTSSRLLRLVNYGERTSTSTLALGYPLLGPPRHIGAY